MWPERRIDAIATYGTVIRDYPTFPSAAVAVVVAIVHCTVRLTILHAEASPTVPSLDPQTSRREQWVAMTWWRFGEAASAASSTPERLSQYSKPSHDDPNDDVPLSPSVSRIKPATPSWRIAVHERTT